MTEFKVGDRVRLVGKPYLGNIVGSEGVVTRSYGPDGVYAEFSMQYPNSPEESKVFPYDPDELELCHPEEDAIRNVLWRIQKEIDSYNMGEAPELIEELKTLAEQLTEQRSNNDNI